MVRAVCCVPVSPLRSEASHKSEMVSQQLFGECCEILGSSTDWAFVRCSYDGYEGWCTAGHLTEIDGPDHEQGSHALTPDWVSEIGFNGHPMMIPMGSALPGMRNGLAAWGRNDLQYKGKAWEPAIAQRDERTIRQMAYRFLNTPYLWGGKSVFGVDCSGFTQTILKFFDVPLLRDAWQQATQGESVGFLEEALVGDLAFFDNEEGRITHVGILLSDHEIIHASGKVRVDKIDNMGIVHAESLQRTHRLRVIKKMISTAL